LKGAEAVVRAEKLIGIKVVRKSRVPKSYRVGALDRKLRTERTRVEAKLLNRTKTAGVECPTVLSVEEFDLVMSFIDGTRPQMDKKRSRMAGEILAKLHGSDIIHGDFTPANLIESKKGGKKGTVGSFYVIDFGLGFVSNDIEDKAVDVFTMLRSLDSSHKKDAFVRGYRKYPKAEKVLERVKEVEKRVRYAF
jgi:Kae1-associated kinase Bud32